MNTKENNVIELHSFVTNPGLTEYDMEEMFPISFSIIKTPASVKVFPMFGEADNCMTLYNSVGTPLALAPILEQDNIKILRCILVSKVLEKHGLLCKNSVGANAYES